MSKIAVILFNLGGPDSLDAVEPFLRNLFSDPAIIGAPGPIRWLLARLISSRRAPVAREIYRHMGGRSPIVPQTKAQANALAAALAQAAPEHRWKVAVAMRYWHPFADEAAVAIKSFAPDRIVLLPLYPQYSTTTTASSFADWDRAAETMRIVKPTTRICCYPRQRGFARAVAAATLRAATEASAKAPDAPLRLLFSAHGLPEKVIRAGDPYQAQVEMSVAAVRAELGGQGVLAGADSRICYQSRVGPLKWIGPATIDEITSAGRDGAAVVVVPIAFVSEHSETLVELDIEYRRLAESVGVPAYVRVPTAGTAPEFIGGMAELVLRAARADGERVVSGDEHGLKTVTCPPECRRCGGPA